MHKLASAFFVTLAAVVSLGSVACNRPGQTGDGQPAAEATDASKAPVTDSWITTKIEAQYFADADVKGRDIDVTTTNGAVTLDGRVDGERARQRAVEIAQKTDGVSKVDDSLEVGPAPASAGATEQASRGWITTKIQGQYFADPDVKGRNIDVTTANGVVTLSGTVDNESARRRAIEIARSTDGVREVEDRLRIEPAGAPRADSESAKVSDEDIADRIEAKYYRDENVGSNDIDVSANAGVVTLSGTVDTESERRRAVMLARRTAGVKDVNDELKVESRVATSGKSGKSAGKSADLGEQIEDAWITTKIQSKFFVDDEVHGDIDVSTNKGVVTLTGEADNPEARQQAEVVARETDGVTRVANRLRVAAKRR
ncbi:MAG: BON domain-containing protein [Vicinamibacterales bacterium]